MILFMRTPDTATQPSPVQGALRLRASVSHLSRQLRAALPGNSISVAKLSVLGHLHRLGPLTPSDLARRERVKLQSLTRLLGELEADEWLLRRAHPRDARQTILSLTRSGVKALSADVHRREASLVAAIASTLSAVEQAQLLNACELIERVADAVAADHITPAQALASFA
jgi:DNA-binding MarR family transcriptional regulator